MESSTGYCYPAGHPGLKGALSIVTIYGRYSREAKENKYRCSFVTMHLKIPTKFCFTGKPPRGTTPLPSAPFGIRC